MNWPVDPPHKTVDEYIQNVGYNPTWLGRKWMEFTWKHCGHPRSWVEKDGDQCWLHRGMVRGDGKILEHESFEKIDCEPKYFDQAAGAYKNCTPYGTARVIDGYLRGRDFSGMYEYK